MINSRILFAIICLTQIIACSENTVNVIASKSWWESVEAITINGDEFYGKPCSVTRVRKEADVRTGVVIFTVPDRVLTYCAETEPGKNYLSYDGEFVVLHVDRQTFGAGSWTGERYRSNNFESWEEYIGVTWVNGEEHVAWRELGSTSSEADSRKKVVRD